MTDKGLISVIMGVYNCAETLSEAIDSILSQTYNNWELIICDDGSTDNTVAVVHSYIERFPQKIILLRNDHNLGLNATLNKCLAIAKGDFVARMDGDDISKPDRFEKEIKTLLKHPDISIVSSNMEFFDENGVWGRTHKIETPQNIDFLLKTPFCHAPCLVKKEVYNAVNGYTVSKSLLRVEDYHLWVKMYAAGYKGMNIMECLYMMRDDRNAQHRRKFKYRINECRVKFLAIKLLHLPLYGYFYSIRPIIVGLLPSFLYRIVHKINK